MAEEKYILDYMWMTLAGHQGAAKAFKKKAEKKIPEFQGLCAGGDRKREV